MQSIRHQLITFALFSYNEERFIAEAIQAAFSQKYTPLEIILSDDSSADRTFEIMQAIAKKYEGPHQIVLRQNERNLGWLGHVNKVMEIVRGDLIVIAAGDDISLPERVEKIWAAFKASDERALAIFSNAFLIDNDGRNLGLYIRKPVKMKLDARYFGTRFGRFAGATQAWHRSVFDVFGPLASNGAFEDVIIPFRASLIGNVIYTDEPLVKYRRHIERIRNPNDRLVIAQARKNLVDRIDNHIAICQSRLKDIDSLLIQEKTERAKLDELLDVHDLTKNLLKSTQKKKEFIHTGWKTKVKILASSFWNRSLFFDFLPWVIRYRFPAIIIWNNAIHYRKRRMENTLRNYDIFKKNQA